MLLAPGPFPQRSSSLMGPVESANFLPTPHVGAEGLGDGDAAIGVLVVLQHGGEGAADGQAAAVEGVDELSPGAGDGAIADAGAAGLEVGAVGAGGDFDPVVLAGAPGLQVVFLGGGEAEVAGAHERH